MASSQQMNLWIALNGKVDGSIGKLGNALLDIGAKMDLVGYRLRQFGKESLTEYMNYDDLMREVKALGEFDDATLRTLNDYNKGVAQSSRYTMQQAAETEKLIAQLGLGLEETQTLMPSVMNLATAGNIGLSESLDYLYYSLNALGEPLEFAGTLADQMSKTSAISAADINTLGESLQRLGSASQFFTGGSDEILAILGGIAQFGKDMQGASAGTQLRNFILTLLAPTKSKASILDELSMTEEEWGEFESYMDDAGISLESTAAAMDKLGFSVYDQDGKLKPAVRIITELDKSLSSLSLKEKNQVLGDLFGKRTTVTAANLLESLPQILEYQEEINNASGYTEKMAETMEGGIGGAVRRLEAAYSTLKETVGEAIAPEATTYMGALTDAMNAITSADPKIINTVVTGLETIAGLGVGLKAAGWGLKIISTIGAHPFLATAVALGAAGMALKTYINDLQDEEFRNAFGTLELDMEALGTKVTEVTAGITAQYTDIQKYSDEVAEYEKQYLGLGQQLSSLLTTDVLTGKTLSEPDEATLYAIGEQMGKAVRNGILNAEASHLSFLQLVFGDSEDPDAYLNAVTGADEYYGGLLEEAEQIGKDIRDQMTAALTDKTLNEQERQAIEASLSRYNEIMAEINGGQSKAAYYAMLEKSQRVGADSLQTYLAEIGAGKESSLAASDDVYDRGIGTIRAEYERRINAATSQDERERLQREMDAEIAAARGSRERNAADINKQYDELVFSALDTAINGSGYAEGWNTLKLLRDAGIGSETDPSQLNYAVLERLGLTSEGLSALYDLYGNEGFNRLIAPYEDYSGIGELTGIFNILQGLKTAWSDYQSGNDFFDGAADYFFGGAAEQAQIQVEANGEEAAQKAIASAQSFFDQNHATMYIQTETGNGNEEEFAEGGRATTPSIFGEAGAEWAIPEEHTQRTAELLNAARKASGFTWTELLGAYGGLNANAGHTPSQIVYSPTIYANDATDVDRKLAEDKRRFERMLKENKIIESVVAYA